MDSRTGLVHAPWSPQPTCTTSTRCPICCTAPSGSVLWRQRHASQKPLIESKAPQSQGLHQPALTPGRPSTRPCAEEPAPSPRCAPASSTCSAWSSGCGGSTKCATAVLAKERRARLWRWLVIFRAKTTVWTGASIAHDKRANARGEAEKASANGAMRVKTALQPQIPPNRASRARSLLDGAWRLLVQRCLNPSQVPRLTHRTRTSTPGSAPAAARPAQSRSRRARRSSRPGDAWIPQIYGEWQVHAGATALIYVARDARRQRRADMRQFDDLRRVVAREEGRAPLSIVMLQQQRLDHGQC